MPVIQQLFAYNTGSPISGTIQVGDIAIIEDITNYSPSLGGLRWWAGPDETLGYVIVYPVPAGDHQTPVPGETSFIGFYGTKNMPNPFNESTFVELVNTQFNQSFTTGNDASTWLTTNGYWNSWVSITPTPTSTVALTPTPTPTVTPTQTPTNTPTLTPTPSSTPTSVTGYSFNLVVLPYNYPSSGNTIMVDQGTPGIGTTDPNVFATNLNAIYFNAIDTNGVNRTNYFASFTGQSVTLTISQTGSTAIYSGDSKAFQSWSSGGDSGFTFGYGVAQPGYSAGTTTLIQSAPTNWVTGQTVTISAVVNGVGVTPTPTATSVTPTPTPTSGATGNGWLFYTAEGPIAGPPTSNGDTIFVVAGNSVFNPNYTGTPFNMFFNVNNNVGTSYLSQFQQLDTNGGTITLSQGSNIAIYSGTASDYVANPQYMQLIVNSPVQMIQSASTPFVSGTTINLVTA